MEGPYDTPDDIYVVPCGEVFTDWGAAEFHEEHCNECGAATYGEPERDED